MINNLILILKGMIIGVANIIPGVSGGTLALTLGIYEKILNILSDIKKNIKKNLKFILLLGIGVVLGILLSSKVISFTLKNYNSQTIFLFVGLILGGLPVIFKEVNKKISITNILIAIFFIIFVLFFNFTNIRFPEIDFKYLTFFDYIILIIVGMVASSTMVIPGISGSFILMILGYYDKIIEIVSDITNFDHLFFNLSILIPFGIGVVIGLILLAKILLYLLNKYKVKTYFAIIGFIIGSIIVLIFQIKGFTFTFINIITCLITFIIGYFVSIYIAKK